MEWVKIRANIIEYDSPGKFLKSYLMVKAKIITISVVVLNECRENTWDTYILKVRVKGHIWK